jgi:23S rRNA (cytosine1962-C5)-methyltransferase
VLSIDSSGPALATAARTWRSTRNSMRAAPNGARPTCSANCALLKSAGRRFDLIILDPPKFAPSAAHAERAARAYRDINAFGFRLLNPGGLLMTYSCSGGIAASTSSRSLPMRRSMPVARHASCAVSRRRADHPVALHFSEGEYLKGLLCQAD